MDEALNGADVERGPWSTGLATVVALLPLVVGVGAGVAADRRIQVGPLGPNDLVYWVVVPLAAFYPTIAALARRMAYAPMTVLVVAAIAPAFVYAGRLLMDPLPRNAQGQLQLSQASILMLASPAILAAGAFVAIEIASTGMRRGVAIGVFGALIAAAVLGAAFLVPLYALNQIPS